MGLLADLYVSEDTEAVGYDTNPEKFESRAQFKGFTVLELSFLWSIMNGAEWDPAMLDEFPCLLEKDQGERLVHRLPAEMVAALGQLTSGEVAALSPQWGAIEELNWPTDVATEVIVELVRLAHLANATGQSLYLWNSV